MSNELNPGPATRRYDWIILIVLMIPFIAATGLLTHLGRIPHFLLFPLIVMGFVWLALVIWIYLDAYSRGMSGLLWGLLVLFGGIIAIVIYLIVRSGNLGNGTRFLARSCPQCGKTVSSDFTVCPYCTTKLRGTCPSCTRPVENVWKVCPYCQQALAE